MKDFTGKLIISFELECSEADADFIQENITNLVENRIDSFLDVTDSTTHVETYSA